MSTINERCSLLINMTRILFIFLIMASVSTLIYSCSKDDVVETDAELVPYFELFANEAAKRGFVVDYSAERIEGLLQDIPNTTVQGQCFHNENIPNKVVIDIDYWNNASKLDKEFIIYHELGHCFLNRDHLDDANVDGSCISIMHSNPGACFFDLKSDNRDLYLDELFLQ